MKSDATSTMIDLIRHGEPVGGPKYRGHSDDALCERGWEQMQQAVGAHRPWNAIVSSPLRRCCDFARTLATGLGVPLDIDSRWMELGFGEWEGRTAAEIMATDPERLSRFWADPIRHAPPGGERLDAFRERVVGAWNDMLARYAGRHVLVVAHAGTIRMATSHVLDMPLARLFRLHVPYAGITRVRVDVDGANSLPRLIFHAGHL